MIALWLARSGWLVTAYALLRGAGAPGPAGMAAGALAALGLALIMPFLAGGWILPLTAPTPPEEGS